jgi:hypothetical protein
MTFKSITPQKFRKSLYYCPYNERTCYVCSLASSHTAANGNIDSRLNWKWGASMGDPVQAFFLGMMAAWTPSLVLLAWMLWRDAGSGHEQGQKRH